MSIAQNIEIVKTNIENACIRAGRNPEEITLIGVTKTHGADIINEGICGGLTHVGENRVQELCEKYEEIQKGVHIHLIGHLQKNKVKYIADKVSMIHSVDSYELAKEIDRQCKKHDKIMDVLVEVNVSGEESKGGITPLEAPELIKSIAAFENIRVKGLMTMAPLNAGEEELHSVFSGLYKLSVEVDNEKIDNVTMQHLSMGMSNDYVTAICENATIIRLGRCLFR